MSKRRVSFRQRLKYRFDNVFAAGIVSMTFWLLVSMFGIVLLTTLILWIFDIHLTRGEQPSFPELMWESFMHALDTGTVAGDKNWIARTILTITTLVGIFILTTLIAIMSAAIRDKLEDLRRGSSMVAEVGHTVILGWSPKIYPIISELIIANENQSKPRIVIMAEEDILEMEIDLRKKIGTFKNTKIIFRTGSPIDMDDIRIVNPDFAKSIILLSPEDEQENADTYIVKSILALTNNPEKSRPYHIVAELNHKENLHLIEMLSSEVCAVLSEDLISRLTVQTCRHSGLSMVYSELLDFDGYEIYFQQQPGLEGKTIREAVLSYKDSAFIGYRTAGGKIALNPPADDIIPEGSHVIAISLDDDTIKVMPFTENMIDSKALNPVKSQSAKLERNLILGWNDKASSIISWFESYVGSGSEIVVLADDDLLTTDAAALRKSLKKQKIRFKTGSITNRETLLALKPQQFDNVIILSYSDMMDVQKADSITLICLLQLRSIALETGKDFNIVSEMMDVRNRDLAAVADVNDFIVSDRLTSEMIAQLSENRELKHIFDEFFEAGGSEIYLRPAGDYIQTGKPVNFYTVSEAALRKGEIAIGYRLAAEASDAGKAYGIYVNPDKGEPLSYATDDKVIVIAEE